MNSNGQPTIRVKSSYWDQLAPTPLVPVQLDSRGPAIWCKLEYMNPSGSTKDRIAHYMIDKALRTGELKAGGLVMEASSGSTCISMATVCAQRGLQMFAVMPEGVSHERITLIEALGAEILLTPRDEGIFGAIATTRRLGPEYKAFLPRQFENPDNASAHQEHTAEEIMVQIPHTRVDAVVSGVGTGGTLVGLYHGIRNYCENVIPVVARPLISEAFGGADCCSFSPRIPGVVDSVSTIFKADELSGLQQINVGDENAFKTARQLIRMGFPVGPSSGLNYRAAQLLHEQIGNPDIQIVTVFPDRMERYFSTGLFEKVMGNVTSAAVAREMSLVSS